MTAQSSWPIADTPNTHGMFMLGTTTLFLCHMPMFGKEDHFYQLTLQASLDSASMTTYVKDRAQNPKAAYNLINLDSNPFTLPDLVTDRIRSYQATIFRGYSNDGGGTPGPTIVNSATVTVDRIVYFRPFNQNIPRPASLTYVLFGDGREAHLDHYIAADPDFQHLLTLPTVPAWLPETQLRSGVSITFAQSSTPIGCAPPIKAGAYSVLFQGIATAPVSIQVGDTFWYSTGNMLNVTDPCPTGPVAHVHRDEALTP